MKKKIATILTIATACGFAQEAIPEVLPKVTPIEVHAMPSIREKATPKKSFGYLKMGIADNEVNRKNNVVLPGFGIGYRLNADSSAIDISTSYNYRKNHPKWENSFNYVLPKVNYLYYLTADKNNSLYAGGGLAWGGVKTRHETREDTNFVGLIPNVALGYEFNRLGVLRSFVQFDVSKPAIAAVREGAMPKAYAEFAVGGGF